VKNKETAFPAITQTLVENISRVHYGESSVTLKVHAGRIVSVTYSTTENTRAALSQRNESGEPGNE
jgi:hypothetical protein